jgi:hypothetical protein
MCQKYMFSNTATYHEESVHAIGNSRQRKLLIRTISLEMEPRAT